MTKRIITVLAAILLVTAGTCVAAGIDPGRTIIWPDNDLGPSGIASIYGYKSGIQPIRAGTLEFSMGREAGGRMQVQFDAWAHRLLVDGGGVTYDGQLVAVRDQQEYVIHGYHPLQVAVPLMDGYMLSGVGEQSLELSLYGIPPEVRALEVRLSVVAPLAGTAVWCGAANSAGPIVRAQAPGVMNDDTGTTTFIEDGRLRLHHTGNATVWVYILGYWL